MTHTTSWMIHHPRLFQLMMSTTYLSFVWMNYCHSLKVSLTFLNSPLELMHNLVAGPDLPQLASLRASITTQQYKIDKEGEMPAEVSNRSAPVSRPSSPSHVDRRNYVVDNEVQPITPEPIKVMKAKKKGSSSKSTRKHDPNSINDTRLG
jgi:hypothetical protein